MSHSAGGHFRLASVGANLRLQFSSFNLFYCLLRAPLSGGVRERRRWLAAGAGQPKFQLSVAAARTRDWGGGRAARGAKFRPGQWKKRRRKTNTLLLRGGGRHSWGSRRLRGAKQMSCACLRDGRPRGDHWRAAVAAEPEPEAAGGRWKCQLKATSHRRRSPLIERHQSRRPQCAPSSSDDNRGAFARAALTAPTLRVALAPPAPEERLPSSVPRHNALHDLSWSGLFCRPSAELLFLLETAPQVLCVNYLPHFQHHGQRDEWDK